VSIAVVSGGTHAWRNHDLSVRVFALFLVACDPRHAVSDGASLQRCISVRRR
jgi:hypothetical protein